MNKPFVSCLCVTYNRPQLIKEAVYFFLAQEYENKELIIVNDQENVTYRCNEPQVKIYNFSVRFPSLGEKRNHAKKLASKNSKFIFWIDDDDVYYPDFLSYMVGEHEKKNVDVLKPHITHFSTNNIISNYKCGNIGFPTSSFTKEYSDKTDFEPLMFGSDQIYFRNAKIHRLSNEKVTSHIRWGLGVYHVSGGSGDVGNKKMQNMVYNEVGKRGKRKTNEIIEIVPEISEDVKKYYKKY